MKENVVAALTLFTSVLIAFVLLTYAFSQAESSGELIGSADRMMQTARTEYIASDVSSMEGDLINGAEVISLVRKKQAKIPVVVTTALATTAYPQSSLAIVNDPSSVSFIDPSGLFLVTVERTKNESVSRIVVMQQGGATAGGSNDPVVDVDVAKNLIATALGHVISVNTTWAGLTEEVRTGTGREVKQVVVDVLGGSASTGMTWQELALMVRTQMNELTAENTALSNAQEANQYQKAQGDLEPGKREELGFVPSVISVVTEMGSETYVSGVWHGGNSCTLQGSALRNDSGYTVTYYAYK